MIISDSMHRYQPAVAFNSNHHENTYNQSHAKTSRNSKPVIDSAVFVFPALLVRLLCLVLHTPLVVPATLILGPLKLIYVQWEGALSLGEPYRLSMHLISPSQAANPHLLDVRRALIEPHQRPYRPLQLPQKPSSSISSSQAHLLNNQYCNPHNAIQ